jgi:hypothetical protein
MRTKYFEINSIRGEFYLIISEVSDEKKEVIVVSNIKNNMSYCLCIENLNGLDAETEISRITDSYISTLS